MNGFRSYVWVLLEQNGTCLHFTVVDPVISMCMHLLPPSEQPMRFLYLKPVFVASCNRRVLQRNKKAGIRSAEFICERMQPFWL